MISERFICLSRWASCIGLLVIPLPPPRFASELFLPRLRLLLDFLLPGAAAATGERRSGSDWDGSNLPDAHIAARSRSA